MKLRTKQKSQKDIKVLSLRAFREKYFHKIDTGSSIEDEPARKTIPCRGNYQVCKLDRDLTVQRKGVWPDDMKQDYFGSVAVGDCDNNALHYVDLESARKTAENTGCINYANHLYNFLKKGFTGTHVDGGNRTDAIIETLQNKLKVEKCIYNFGVQDNGESLYFTLEEDTYFEDLDENFQNAILDCGSVLICTYFNLTKTARKELFRTLNDGLPLNRPELRNSEESDVCAINRNFDLEYADLFVKTNVLSESGAARWGTAERVAEFKYVRRNLQTIPLVDNVVVKWPSANQLDEDYMCNSAADMNAIAEHEFFMKEFVSYLEVLKKDKSSFPNKVRLSIDLWMIISWMKKENYDLIYQVTQGKKLQFVKAIFDQYYKWCNEKDAKWISKMSAGKPLYCEFSQLYTKNNDMVLSQRLNRWVEEFIKKSDLITKVTKRVVKRDDKLIGGLIEKQNGVTTLSTDKHEINTLKIGNGVYHIEHTKDVRGGGPDDPANMTLELKEDNQTKGARRS
jgi:hypothetical protein